MLSHLEEIDIICDKDAKRTFGNKPLFSKQSGPGTQLVFNITKAVGAYFPKSGYCQGISWTLWFYFKHVY
jgi:hypothetical protein